MTPEQAVSLAALSSSSVMPSEWMQMARTAARSSVLKQPRHPVPFDVGMESLLVKKRLMGSTLKG